MHGPDGRDYQNRITFDEIVPPERIAYHHGGADDVEPVEFKTVVTFEEIEGKTKLTMWGIFPSAEERARVIREYGADKGQVETLGRLADYVARLAQEPMHEAGLSMSLKLYFHPFSSYCQKVLTALYENDTPFTPHVVDLMDEAEGAAFRQLWPISKFPVLRDESADLTIPESTIIIEYLAQRYPGRTALLPAHPDQAREARFRDRFFDLHVHEHVQKIVFDRLRPPASKDAFGVEQARDRLRTAYAMLDAHMAQRTWATGEDFTIADCAAAPSLFYANLVLPFSDTHKSVAAYLDRLMQRPSFARVVREAEPFRPLFPKE